MEILEFGNNKKEKIVLIHGFETPYQIWEEYIEYYQKDYHVIVPILPGHNPKINESFISFNEISKEIEDYLISRYGNNVYAVYGMSMGGIVAAYLLQNKNLNIKKVILESSPLLSYNKLVKYILKKSYLVLTHKAKTRHKKTVKQAINNIVPANKLNEFLEVIDNISDRNIINYIEQIGNYKFPQNLDVASIELYYYHGTKLSEMFAKKTAKYIKKYYSKANIICFKGKAHCENMLMNPEKMVKELDKVLK